MFIKEYRIILPCTLDEYRIGYLYAAVEISKQETGHGEGIEYVEHHPYSNNLIFDGNLGELHYGYYTRNVYHLLRKLPDIAMKAALPRSLRFEEKSWNAHPYYKTRITSLEPDICGSVHIEVDTVVTEYEEEEKNVHHLKADELERREVIHIDMVSGHDTLQSSSSVCVYKIVKSDLSFLNAEQETVEDWLSSEFRRLFSDTHQTLLNTKSDWQGLSIGDIRAIEAKSQVETNHSRHAV